MKAPAFEIGILGEQMPHLEDDSRFPHPRFTDDPHHLTWPERAFSRASWRVSISLSLPTNLVRPETAEASSLVLTSLACISS